MAAYRLIDHTADIGIEVEANDRDGLFLASLEALTDCLTDLATVRTGVCRGISIRAASEDLLLVDWLEELVYAFEVHRELYSGGAVAVTDDNGGVALEADLVGETFDPERHPVRFVIKAVTYHDLSVKRRDGGWSARVVFDL